MITIKNESIKSAVISHKEKKSKIAIKADSTPTVLNKILDGSPDFSLSAAHRIADYLDFDVEVNFIPRKGSPESLS